MKGKKLQLSQITIDGGTQSRAGLDQSTVDEYAENMLAGDEFDPIEVYHDGEKYWLADGFHRVAAARQAKLKSIGAEVHQGSQRDAVLHSVGANSKHGLRRTNADKRRAVETLLRDEEWAQWSNREIARRCGVDDTFVGKIRTEVTAVKPQSTLRKGADGRVIETARIGGKAAPGAGTPGTFYWSGRQLPYNDSGTMLFSGRLWWMRGRVTHREDLIGNSGFFVCVGDLLFLPKFARLMDAEASELWSLLESEKRQVISFNVLRSACGHFTILELDRVDEPSLTPDEALAQILGEDEEDDPVTYNWVSTALYPVDRQFRTIYSHPMGEDEWSEYAPKFYPRCIGVRGTDIVLDKLVEDQGFSVLASRVPVDADPVPEVNGEDFDDWSEVLEPDKHYIVNRNDKIVWLRAFGGEVFSMGPQLAAGEFIAIGREIIAGRNSRQAGEGWRVFTLEEPKIGQWATTAGQPAHYQAGMAARCGVCESTFAIQDAIYDDWQLDQSRPSALTIWRCPKGHRIADSLMDIVTIGELAHISQMAAYDPPSAPAINTHPTKFAAILIDPPWKYDTYSEDTGEGRSAESHYPTMTPADLAGLPVGELARDDCALFMWVTWPTLQQAFAVAAAWGFDYKTCAFTWAKVRKGLAADSHAILNMGNTWHFGMGFWTRANSEVCLLFTKGSPKRVNADVPQLIVASVRKHSQKPDEIYSRIERLVDGPYIEMFARQKHDGWYAWGNEVESDITFGGITAAGEKS